MEKSFDFGRILKKHVKQKPVQFLSVSGGVKKRLEANLQSRKSNRLTVFDNFRKLSKCESPPPALDNKSKSEHRLLQLAKWKEEKEKQKKEAAAKKKKPFIVGVAHASLKFVPPPPPKAMPSSSGRVTRSQTSKSTKVKVEKEVKAVQSFAPKNATFRPPNLSTKEIPVLAPVSKKVKKNNTYNFVPVLPNSQKQNTRQTRSKSTNVKSVETKTIPSVTHNDKVKGRVTKKQSPKKHKKNLSKTLQSSSSSEIDRPKTHHNNDSMVSRTLPILDKSNCLISSSSSDMDAVPAIEKSPALKKTPRKSITKPLKTVTPKTSIPKSESSSEEKLRSPKSIVDVPMTPEQVSDESKKISPCVTMSRGKDNARREMKKKMEEGLLDDDISDMDSVENFRWQLDSETRRITERCDLWDKIQEETTLPESVQELVLAAVGQGRLLVAQKFRQFRMLVDTCARPQPGASLVTPVDLRGFWDMVFMQVENIDLRFKKLEELRLRNWVEEIPVETKKRVAKINVKKPAKAAGGPSRLRDMIAAARKAKKQQELTPASSQITNIGSEESKTFEAGFFSVKSPVRSPVVATPTRRPNLLKTVLSSEAKKSVSKNSTSFAILRASVLSKNMDHEGVAPLPQTPVNLSATPGRSILKSANTTSKKKSSKKSIKVVLFDETEDADKSTEVNDEENKENLSRKSKLVRQDAVVEDTCGVITRSRRKSMNTPKAFEDIQEKTLKRSAKKKA